MGASGIPFLIGTMIYFGLGLIACFITGRTAQQNKFMHMRDLYTLITVTVVCMWMLWGMCWLMQWHPIIAPDYNTSGD